MQAIIWFAGVVKLVDTPDLGSGGFAVRVRVSPPAPFFVNIRKMVNFFSKRDCYER